MYDFLIRSSIETIALKLLPFEKMTFVCTDFGDKQTNEQMDSSIDA